MIKIPILVMLDHPSCETI